MPDKISVLRSFKGRNIMFILNEMLGKDSVFIGNFPLCQLLLKNDKTYPWFILVPRRTGVIEIFDLLPDEQQQLWVEVASFGSLTKTLFNADKINVATLGNMVSQLHIHVIARHKTDQTWPQSVWDKFPAVAYETAEIDKIIMQLRGVMPDSFVFGQ